MAKKGQGQLQVEVNSDDEWSHLLERKGLIVVDVYSDWCGPCLAMSANLKKIKLEIGGDMLILALAKSDNIEDLQRFRNKSEPTWMFISNKKMVNLMFGADAPKLTRLIVEQLDLQRQAMELNEPRDGMEVTELAPEEQERKEVLDNKARIVKEKEEAKKEAVIRNRRTAECKIILDNLKNYGVILVFPNAKTKWKEAISEYLGEAGAVISQTEKIKPVTEEIVEELLYFSNHKFPPNTIKEFTSEQSLGLLLKRSSDNLASTIDDVVLQLVYGNSRQFPGDENSPSRTLLKLTDAEEVESALPGIWAPENSFVKASALKLLFPNLSSPFKSPDIDPVPLHIIVSYDVFKDKDIFELVKKYPNEILAIGYFSNDIVGEAQLIAKTSEKFETKTLLTTYEEKIVVQLAKRNSDCLMAFMDLGPSYMSQDAVQGEEEAKIFFPDGYNEPELEVVEVKKKSKRRMKAKQTAQVEVVATESEASLDVLAEIDHEDETLIGEEDIEEQDDEEHFIADISDEGNLIVENEALCEADKATSPLRDDLKSQ